MDDPAATALKAELVAAEVPVRAVLFDGNAFAVTYWPTVTAEHLERAAPILTAAREKVRAAD